jgi:hypothetical protein
LLTHLEFWQKEENLSQGISFLDRPVQETITTDASKAGWGGHFRHLRVQGLWTTTQKNWHINSLELMAVFLTLKKFVQFLCHKKVRVKTDNIVVREYINQEGGTGSPTLCKLTLHLLSWCLHQGIVLVAEYVPGVQNTMADSLSRQIVSQTEWSLDRAVAQALFRLWGFPEVDLFATAVNRQVPVFCSWLFQEESLHSDSMTLSCRNLQAYAFPPIALINRTILKAREECKSLILIAPNWPTRPWFPLLLQSLIDDPVQLPLKPDLLTQDEGALWHHNPAVLSLVAWRISGRPLLRKAYLDRLRKQSWQPSQLPPIEPISLVGSIMHDGVGGRVSIPLRPL